MFDVVDYPNRNLLALTISGTLSKADYDSFVPLIDQKIEQWGKLNLYLDVRSFDYITASALWEDIKQDVKHWNDFHRVAITSDDSNLLKAAAALGTLVSSAEIRHFPLEHKEEAIDWALGAEKAPDVHTEEIHSS
ncbi:MULTISPECIES: SpoIIAA family protein [Hymenobacter]|uniref:STAS/SEC14 domain-containing protein n=1 Tax=Hymenobacter jejuensis TaxID=2502781 RepID=A0A5B8A0J0_9BACT|nr:MULTISPECIES: STAS/SEC14 domain-containing protein [Hymenobacter]MBC6991889.1 STAS/SEC14 domain-containing protein [Hymenobacter sp. BT491]QDA60203.1 STAS/SEC14 domain-containing protein [Hymenobacter jejuensis]